MQPPSTSSRLRLNGHLGTIRYSGEVQGARGTWLGVEWDDPSRGKHSGEKDGVQYFACSKANAGSFIRPAAPGISLGQSFLTALSSKYVEEIHGSTEKLILGSSNGAIEVEAVNLDLIRGNLSRLETLREVSLEDVASADPAGDVRKKSPGIQGLDISNSLVANWDAVAKISFELKSLERLSLNRTRLTLPQDLDLFAISFAKLTELQISSTLMQWPQLLGLLDAMPSLVNLEFGLNELTSLSSQPIRSKTIYNLESLNLDSNRLTDWADLCNALEAFPSLRRLLLTANHFERVPVHASDKLNAVLRVEQLLLTGNRLNAWSDVDNLTAWAPKLTKLRLRDNPLYEDLRDGKYHRQLLVAKIPTLTELDGTVVSQKERRDCEIFYISHVAQSGLSTEEDRQRHHPRWKELCEKWGAPDEASKAQKGNNTLGSQLINLNIHRCDSPPTAANPPIASSATFKALQTMTLKVLRMKIAKSFKLPRKAGDSIVRLWLPMGDSKVAELPLSQDDADLTWWGLESGADVFMYFGS